MILRAAEVGSTRRAGEGRVRRRGVQRGRAARGGTAPPRARLPGVTQAHPGADHRTILTGTAANVIGLLVGVVAAFGVQALFGRGLPAGGLGVVTLAVQVAFVASAGGRFGMDMTAIRRVAIDNGSDERATLRSLVDRATLIAGLVSMLLAILVAAFGLTVAEYHTVAVAATAIPAIAVANVYLGATRGLRLMKPTLWLFWIGQPVLWIATAGVALLLGGGIDAATLSYTFSWVVMAVLARMWWMRLSAGMGDQQASRAEPESPRCWSTMTP